MSGKRRTFSADFKARVARDAMREADTLKAVAARHGVHPSQVKQWRERFEAAVRDGAKREADQAATIKELHAKIGELTMERDFFQERWRDEPQRAGGAAGQERPAERGAPVPPAERQPHGRLPPHRTGSQRSRPGPHAPHGRHAHGKPGDGHPPVRGATAAGRHCGGGNRVHRLMRVMGIRHVAPPPKTSVAAPHHKVYPYLLSELVVTEPDQVWRSDITYKFAPTHCYAHES